MRSADKGLEGFWNILICSQSRDVDSPSLSEVDVTFRAYLTKEQGADPTLSPLFKKAKDGSGLVPALGKEGYIVQNNLLYRQSEEGLRLVVPHKFRREVLELGHTKPWAGHIAHRKTLQRIGRRFHCPGLFGEVKSFCKSCPQCQLSGGKGLAHAPFIPFQWIDIVGPLESSKAGNSHLVV